MKKNKLVLTLQFFDKKTLNRLGKFIQSPYFNKDQTLYQLFLNLTAMNAEKQSIGSKEELWKLIRPDQEYNDMRFRKYNSDLLGLVEDFLILEELEEEKNQKDILLLRAIGRRGIKVLQKSAIALADKSTTNKTYLGTSNLFQQYQVEKEKYNLIYRFDRKQKSNIQHIINNFDQFYFAERYKLSSDQISRGKFTDVTFVDKLGSALIELLDSSEIQLESIGQIYKAVYETQNTASVEAYFTLRKLTRELSLPMAPNEGSSIYASLINFCINKINQGESNFLEELFEIYKELIDKDYVLSKGVMSPTTYVNIAITALRNKEYSWAEDFVLNYNKYLAEDIRENLKRFQLSRIYFFKKDFEAVIGALRNFEFSDVIDNLQTKGLLIQTYYELSEFDALDSLLRSLKTYITRHKEIDPGRRKNYKNLIKIITQMMSTIPGDKKKINKLRSTMSAMKGIAANREWLEEKILELERGK